MDGCSRCTKAKTTTVTVLAEGREWELDLCPFHLQELLGIARSRADVPHMARSNRSASGLSRSHTSHMRDTNW
jgi:hypothetical protein